MNESPNDMQSGRWTGRGVPEHERANAMRRPGNWAGAGLGSAAMSLAASGHWLAFLIMLGAGLAVWLLLGAKRTEA